MKRPTEKANYTKQELREYAEYRKDKELKDKEPREPLAITELRQITIELNWVKERSQTLSAGGDADGFKFWLDQDGEIVNAVYYWADRGVYEEVELDEDEAEKIAARYGLI